MGTQAYALKHKLLGLCRSCPNPVVLGSNTYCKIHREKDRIRGRVTSKVSIVKLKTECLLHYGNSCICCGETIQKFLTIDHKDGNGNLHRKALFRYNVGGIHMYRWLKKNGFPDNFQILCMNCNWATRLGEICPHKMER